MRALEFKSGSEVIVPSYTFIATVHAIKACGLVPRFCDVDAKTHLITVETISACLTPETVAIVGVHLWGLCCDVASLTALAKAHNLTLLFDAAHAFGSRDTDGVCVGNFGKAEVFSMHATKLFNSFEGGLITTNDLKFDLKLRRMRNFGFEGQDLILSWGTNIKLSEIHASFAVRQLVGIRHLLETYRTNASVYCEEFKKTALAGVEVWNERFILHLQHRAAHRAALLAQPPQRGETEQEEDVQRRQQQQHRLERALQADAIPERRLPGKYLTPAGGWMPTMLSMSSSHAVIAEDDVSAGSSSNRYGCRDPAALLRQRVAKAT
ncbi:GDP-perosamine synthase [Pycnococcus provasolii]